MKESQKASDVKALEIARLLKEVENENDEIERLHQARRERSAEAD